MTEQEVMRLLRAVHKLDIKEREEQIAKERASCLSLTRARALVLNPNLWTIDERKHVDKCRYCARLIEKFEQSIWHPSLLMLLRSLLGKLKDEEAQAVQYHLEREECQRCIRMANSPMLRKIAEAVRMKKQTIEQVQALMNSAVNAFATLLALVGDFAETTRLPFHVRAESEDGLLIVTVRETDEGELAAYVETPNSEFLGRKVHVELIGERETLTAEITFDFQYERGCVGQHSFGQFEEVATRLGNHFQVFAVLTE
ncbi:MAG: hypothetical protein N2381_00580 [Armatimonadetes bacterium]|nr:hypothetical protein [Armatimonadota bacterium]